jgi:diguanylate cyclase (GGDEF)-like protein
VEQGTNASKEVRGRQRFAFAELTVLGLVVLLGAIAASAWWWLERLPAAGGANRVGAISPWVLLVAFAAAEAFVVRFHFRGETHNASLAELPLAVGLVFVTPAALLVARVFGPLVVFLARRQRVLKLCFNMAAAAAEASVALAVYRVVLAGASPVSPRGWCALAIATIAADTVSHLAVVAAIRATSGPLEASSIRIVAVLASAIAVVNASLGVQAVLVLWVDPRIGWALLCTAAGLLMAERAHAALRRRYARLDSLYAFTEAVGDVHDADAVVERILAATSDILRAQRTELVLPGPDDDPLVFAFDALAPDGPLQRRSCLNPSVTTAWSTGRARLLAREVMGDAVVSPFRDGESVAGMLVATDRLRETTTFDEEDLKLFQAMANHAGAALRNAQLVDQLRDEAEAMEHRALHDALTGLPNRTFFERAATELLRSETSDLFAVFLLDLDGFKEVNDSLGHPVGDLVLGIVGERLANDKGDDAVVARLGGDEFALALRIPQDQTPMDMARRMRAAVARPTVVSDVPVDVRASVGVAVHDPSTGQLPSVIDLLRQADVAMYEAKHAGSHVEVYSVERDPHSPERLSLLVELRQAVEEGTLLVHYQPQVDASRRRVLGVEALIRWPHPRLGFIPPDQFIPMAERAGLIGELTIRVLRSAIDQLASWHLSGWGHLSMAVNVSPRALADDRLVPEIDSMRRRSGVPAECLVLELTESAVMSERVDLAPLLELAARGVRLSIDDFGTGYSSLVQLKRLPFTELKIDKGFVQELSERPDDLAIVRSIIHLAAGLDLHVIAEGVEDEATATLLVTLGCRALQGYHFSRPLPPARFEEWLLGASLAPPRWPEAAEAAEGGPRLRIVAER